MANNNSVYQQKTTVSVPKQDLLEWVVYNKELSKKDYRVFLMLLTELNGYTRPLKNDYVDPKNFSMIDEERISDKLDMKIKDVHQSIKTLKQYGIIESGNSNTGVDGFRFTF